MAANGIGAGRSRAIRLGVIAFEFPALSETFVIDQVLAQAERGFDVTVFADHVNPRSSVAHDRRLLDMAHPRWGEANRIHSGLDRLPRRLRRVAEAFCDLALDGELDRRDALLAHFGQNGSRLARLRSFGRLSRPFATIFHGNDIALPMRAGQLGQYKRLFAVGDLFLPVSQYFADVLIAAGAPADRVRVHRTGVDCDSVAFRTREERTSGLSLITACRFVEKKGLEFALRSLRLFSDRRPEKRWTYSIVGDGPLRPDLERLSGELELSDRVAFLGPAPHAEVKGLLDQADAYVLPSVTASNGDMEGVPVALMEAMAAGLPVVSSTHSGIPELITSHVTGLLAPERDADALSMHLEWLFDHPAERMQMAFRARKVVETNFNQSRLNDSLAEMMSELAGRQNTAV
jgi:colanic acid/amylovoran biosynthesis glycosyltransferase